MTNPDPLDQSARAAELIAAAESFAERSDWASADAKFHDALSLDCSPVSRIAYGVFLAERERYFDAISVFTPVLDGNDRAAIGVVCHNLASIYRIVDDLDLARRFQWRATLLQEDLDEKEVLGMANDALASQRPEVAESLVLTACAMAGDDDDDEISDADLTATMGLVQAALKSPRHALVTLFHAYRQHQAAYDLRGMGMDLLNMALLFGGADRRRAERSCILRAIRCFEQASLPFSSRRARHQLARIDRMQSVRSFDARRN